MYTSFFKDAIQGRKKLEGEKREKKLKLQRTYHRLADRERNISALKRVKVEMRSIMENERLNSLMVLSTQNDIAMEIDYNEVINGFIEEILRFSKKIFVVQVQ
ncbi:hypothetical protein TNCV_378431 [Trichonephila clavipes]|nr:hypothetical protein TNCV_378431 [Trichonephila clavipes]